MISTKIKLALSGHVETARFSCRANPWKCPAYNPMFVEDLKSHDWREFYCFIELKRFSLLELWKFPMVDINILPCLYYEYMKGRAQKVLLTILRMNTIKDLKRGRKQEQETISNDFTIAVK